MLIRNVVIAAAQTLWLSMSSLAQQSRVRPMVTSILAATLVAAGTIGIYQKLNYAGTEHRTLAADVMLSLFASCVGMALAGSHSFDLVEPALAFVARASKQRKLLLVCLALIALFLVARFVLDAFPNSGDEYAYVLQAESYARGRLWVEPPQLPEAFALAHFQVKNGMWLSQYAPGWALILASAVLLKVPLWMVNPILGVGLLCAFFALAREQMGKEAAAAGAIGLAGSAFFILNAASYFSHVACALWGVLYSLFAVRYLRSGKPIFAVFAGAFVGLLGLTRPFDAFIFMLPFIITLAASPRRRGALLPFMLGGAPFAVALLAFNQAITGSAFTMVQIWVNAGREPIGVLDAQSFYFRLVDFVRLAVFTSPLLVAGFAPAFVLLLRRQRLAFTDWIAPLTVIGFCFYASVAGDQYGPRYFFEAFPFAILTIIKPLDGYLFAKPTASHAPLLASALLLHFSVQIGYLGPVLAREHQVVIEREQLYREVADAHLTNAVVLLTTGTGKIRPMPPQDLVRNGLRVGGQTIVYAHDLGTRNELIQDLFPERTLYLNVNGKLSALR